MLIEFLSKLKTFQNGDCANINMLIGVLFTGNQGLINLAYDVKKSRFYKTRINTARQKPLPSITSPRRTTYIYVPITEAQVFTPSET